MTRSYRKIVYRTICKCYSSQRAKEELGYRNRPVRQTVEEAW